MYAQSQETTLTGAVHVQRTKRGRIKAWGLEDSSDGYLLQ